MLVTKEKTHTFSSWYLLVADVIDKAVEKAGFHMHALIQTFKYIILKTNHKNNSSKLCLR